MRLNFSSTKLYGRDAELEELGRVREAVQRQRRSRFVLLEGYSGNGKTSLVHHFGTSLNANEKENQTTGSTALVSENFEGENFERIPRKKSYIKGKFDEHNQKPYAAFVQAFGEILGYIGRHREQETVRIRRIRDALGTEAHLITEVIPQLSEILSRRNSLDMKGNGKKVLGGGDRDPQKKKLESNGMLERRHQFRFRFQALVRAICNDQSQPIVLFCDDLQWADMSSLELLKTVLTDSSSNNLMVVGAYRGHEVQDSGGQQHPLMVTIKQLRNLDFFEQGIVEIRLNDFGLDDLNTFVADAMDLAPQKAWSLSEVIARKTLGNIFYTKEFLKHLVTKELIKYDMTYYQWTWETEEIVGATNITENVVDLVASRIQELPPQVVAVLKIASCLWFSFDVTVLEFIVIHAREKLACRKQEGEASFRCWRQ